MPTSPRTVRDAAVDLARYLTPEESFTPTQRRETVALLLDFAEAILGAVGAEERRREDERIRRARHTVLHLDA